MGQDLQGEDDMLPALQLKGEYPYNVAKEVEDIWIINEVEELDDVLAELYKFRAAGVPVALDTETDDVDPKEESPAGKGEIVTTQIAWIEAALYFSEEEIRKRIEQDECEIVKVWIDCRDPRMLQKLKMWIEDEECPKVLQGGKFDQHEFANHGIQLRGVVGDTLGMSHLQYPERLSHSLDGAQGLVATILKEKRLTTLQALGVNKIGKKGQMLKSTEYVSMGAYVVDDDMRPYQQVYSCFDVWDTIRLYYIIKQWLEEMEWQDDERGLWGFWEDKLCRYNYEILYGKERQGVCIDEEVLDYLLVEYNKLKDTLTEEIYELIGIPINLNSYQHKAWLLYGDGIREFKRSQKKGDTFEIEGWSLPCQEVLEGRENPWEKNRKRDGSWTSGFPSTDGDHLEWTLERTEDEDVRNLITLIGDRQKVTKLISGTLEPIKKNLRDRHITGVREPDELNLLRYIHGVFNVKARTGRLACALPNLQQVPSRTDLGKVIRHAFICEPGEVMLVVDYEQLELNILGCYLAKLFGDMEYAQLLRNGDIHQDTADRLDIPRFAGKTINFGIIYGMSKYKLARELRIPIDEAERKLREYAEAYPAVERYNNWAVKYAKRTGTARTLMGRYRQLPNINDCFRQGSWAGRPTGAARQDERRARNTPIQGSAQDIVAEAQMLLNSDEELKSYEFVMRMAVHDEIVSTCRAKYKEVALARKVYLMENAVTFPEFKGVVRFPVEGHWGMSWGEAKAGGLFKCPDCGSKSRMIHVGKCSTCDGDKEISLEVASELDWRTAA